MQLAPSTVVVHQVIEWANVHEEPSHGQGHWMTWSPRRGGTEQSRVDCRRYDRPELTYPQVLTHPCMPRLLEQRCISYHPLESWGEPYSPA
jgi:hypothetical protein